METALVSLECETAVSALRNEKTGERIERRRLKYQQAICMGVYWAGAEAPLARPGTRVRLRIGENEYKPETQNHPPVRQTFRDDGTHLYRTDTFVFPRTVDGTDVLSKASKIGLWLESWYFTGRWADNQN